MGQGFSLVTRLKLIDFDQDFLVFAFNLTDFNFDLSRRVVRNCASVAAQVHMVFLAEIVLVEQSSAERRNADKKLAAIWSLNRFRCQWCIARIMFHDGSRPGIFRVKIGRNESGAGVGESTGDFIFSHVLKFRLPVARAARTASHCSPAHQSSRWPVQT